MSFGTLLTHRVSTFRNVPTGMGVQRGYSARLVQSPAMIQPLSAEYAARVNLVFGRAYNLFLPLNSDVQMSDKVIDQDGKEYRVVGSAKRNYGVSAPHLTFIINEQIKGVPDQ